MEHFTLDEGAESFLWTMKTSGDTMTDTKLGKEKPGKGALKKKRT